jgi:hypothetical protein
MATENTRLDEPVKAFIIFTYSALLLAGAFFILLIFALRFWFVFSQHGLIPTTGVESSGSFGIFNVCVGRAPYHDFAAASNVAVFNFGFYEVYGRVVRLFADCEVATPLYGRLLTVLFSAALAVAIYSARDERLHPLEAIVIALGVFSSYFGWWSFALRPDIGAATFFALCLITMLRYLANPKLSLALLVGFFLLCSWAFKQPLAFAGPVLLWYVWRQNPRHAVAFCTIVLVGIVIPFAGYGIRPYFLHAIYAEGSAPLIASNGVRNLISFLMRAAPTLSLAGLVIVSSGKAGLDIERKFLLTMLLVSFLFLGVSAAKLGADDNYYFPTFVVASMLVIRYLRSCGLLFSRIGMASYTAVWTLSAFVILTGYRGAIEMNAFAKSSREMAAELNQMPPPKLIWDDVVALPWFTKDVETRVFWYRESTPLINHGYNPRTLVSHGHYETVAIPRYAEHGFDLSRYRFAKAIEDLRIYALRH